VCTFSEEQQHEVKQGTRTAVDPKICPFKAPTYNPHIALQAGGRGFDS